MSRESLENFSGIADGPRTRVERASGGLAKKIWGTRDAIAPPNDSLRGTCLEIETRLLVEQAAAGSKGAFGLLVERFKGRIFAAALVHLGAREDAEDAAQEAFLQAFRSLHGLREPDRFGAWLFGLARNVFADRFRRRRREQARFDELIASGQLERRPGAGVVVRGDVARAVDALLQELDPDQRTALALRLFEERSYREIAELMDTTADGVRGLIYRGMKRLRERIVPSLKEG